MENVELCLLCAPATTQNAEKSQYKKKKEREIFNRQYTDVSFLYVSYDRIIEALSFEPDNLVSR